MRFEGKSEAEALEKAARELNVGLDAIDHRVVRDEKSFWGGRVVEIDAAARGVESSARVDPAALPEQPERPDRAAESSPAEPAAAPEPSAPRTGEDPFAAVETTLAELLSAAGLLVEIRRRPSEDEMVFELIGDDVEPLLANRGEGLNGLEVLAGRIASRRVGEPVHPRLDAEGFRRHQKESLEELAFASAAEVKRTRRPQLLPPLSPGERRLVHLALADDPEVETESEGSGFLKRVAVKPKG